eukprot:3666230-Amphidinium_carterae.1
MDDITTFEDVKTKIIDYFHSTYEIECTSHSNHSHHQRQAPMKISRAKVSGKFIISESACTEQTPSSWSIRYNFDQGDSSA